MKNKFKTPRGFYREVKGLGFSKKKIKALEFWLKHNADPSKDVRFIVYWAKNNEIVQAWDYVASMDKTNYEGHVLLRHIDTPRTRKEKAIYKSQMHGIPHFRNII